MTTTTNALQEVLGIASTAVEAAEVQSCCSRITSRLGCAASAGLESKWGGCSRCQGGVWPVEHPYPHLIFSILWSQGVVNLERSSEAFKPELILENELKTEQGISESLPVGVQPRVWWSRAQSASDGVRSGDAWPKYFLCLHSCSHLYDLQM